MLISPQSFVQVLSCLYRFHCLSYAGQENASDSGRPSEIIQTKFRFQCFQFSKVNSRTSLASPTDGTATAVETF